MTPVPRRGRPATISADAIARAALALWDERGYEDVPVGEVASAVGITTRTVFRYFHSKSDIVWNSIDTSFEDLRYHLGRVPAETTLVSAIRTGILAWLDITADAELGHQRMRIIGRTPELQVNSSPPFVAWHGVLRDYVARRCGVEQDALTPQVVASSVQAATMSALTWWSRYGKGTPDWVIDRALRQLEIGFDTGPPLAAEGAGTRQRIMAATMTNMAELGYNRATMKSIAEEAGLTSASIYHYFRSKHELALAVLTSTVDEVVRRLHEAVLIEGSLRERFVGLLEAVLAVVKDYPAVTRFEATVYLESVRHPEFAPEYEREREAEERLYHRLIDDAVQNGELPADTNSQCMVDMFSSLTWGLRHLAATASVTRHRAAIRAIETLLDGYLFGRGQPGAGHDAVLT